MSVRRVPADVETETGAAPSRPAGPRSVDIPGDPQANLRKKIKELISLLKDVEFATDVLVGAFEQARKEDIGGPYSLNQMTSGKAATFQRLFGFKGNTKYLRSKTKGGRDINAAQIKRIYLTLRDLSYDVGEEYPGKSAPDWEPFLDRSLSVVRSRRLRASHGEAAPILPHPAWRFVKRFDAVAAILDKFKLTNIIAITGMSGIGKTVLARQVAEAVRTTGGAVVECDAERWLIPRVSAKSPPRTVGYVALWAHVLKEVAVVPRQKGLSPTQHTIFRSEVQHLLQRWSDGTKDLELGERQFLEAIGQRSRPASFTKGIVDHYLAFRNPILLADIAAILPIVVGEAVVILDHVLNIGDSRAILAALFGLVHSARSGSPLRLLTLSQQETGIASVDAKGFDLTGAVERDLAFARQVISAWAAPGEDDLPRFEAEARIGAFRSAEIDSDPQVSSAIDRIIDEVDGHPLALAALASVWRYGGHRPGFWTKALQTVQTRPADLFHLQISRDPEGLVDPRLMNVLGTLRLAWRLLEDGNAGWEATRDRFLDLAVSAPGEPIDERVFVELWRRVGRGPSGERLPPVAAIEQSPLSRMQAVSLVHEVGETDTFILHDLHRMLIEEELGSKTALEERHRDLLRAFGMLSPEGVLTLDEEIHFRVEGDRTFLRPDIGEDADEVEVADVGDYLLRQMARHLRYASSIDTAVEQEAKLATTFRFLQSRLDMLRDAEARAGQAGNIESLLTVFEGTKSGQALLLRRVLGLAGGALVRDRKQLAGQLLARLPRGNDGRIEKLRGAAAHYAPIPALIPRRPFLSGGEGGLIGRLVSKSGSSYGARWIPDAPSGPAVLTWSGESISLWCPETGRVRLEVRAYHSGVLWIGDAPGGPAILAWNREIHLWDARTGETRLQIKPDSNIKRVSWINDAFGVPSILASSDDNNVILFDATKGDEVFRSRHHKWRLSWPTRAWDDCGASWVLDHRNDPFILHWSKGDRAVRLWDPATGRVRRKFSHQKELRGAAWVASCNGTPCILSWSGDGIIRLWAPSTGQLMAEMSHGELAGSIRADAAFHAQWIEDAGNRPLGVLSWSSNSNALLLWDPATRVPIACFSHSEGVSSARWIEHTQSLKLILSTSGNRVQLWDLETRKECARVQHGEAAVGAQWVTLGPNSRPAILSFSKQDVVLSDAMTGKWLARWPIKGGVSGVDWIPDILGGQAILTWSQHPGIVRVLALSDAVIA